MARPREFQEDEVLEAAMLLFWRRGYEATSVADLTAELGLGRGSLYGAFGDKHGLFLRALDRYGVGQAGALLAVLAQDGPVLPTIRAVLLGAATDSAACGQPAGCFLVNTAAELAPRDTEATQRVKRTFDRVEEALAAAMERARDQGELAPGVDPRQQASVLLTLLQGLQILVKAGTDPQRLRTAIDAALAPMTVGHRPEP